MADLAIPCSLSDILERVIPGSLLISSGAFAFRDLVVFASPLAGSPLAYAAFLAGSTRLASSSIR